MPTTPPRLFRLLLIEDDEERVDQFRQWLPAWAHLVWAQSAGSAIGIIRRDRGYVYGGVLLDHDLEQRTKTEDDLFLSGTEVTQALVKYFSIDIPILIHSMNQAYALRIRRQLESKGFWVKKTPYCHLTQTAFMEWVKEARDLWEN